MELRGAQTLGFLCPIHFRSQPATQWRHVNLLRSEWNDLRSDSRKEIVWKYVNPVQGAGPDGSAMRPRLVELLPAATRDSLKLTDEQNKKLDALQPEFESKLAGILSPEQSSLWKEPPKAAGPGWRRGAGHSRSSASVEKLLKITTEQTKVVEGLGNEADARVARILTADQAKQLQEIRSAFVNGWGPVGPPNLGNAVYRSYRYAADYPGLKGRELKPGKAVEELEAASGQGAEPRGEIPALDKPHELTKRRAERAAVPLVGFYPGDVYRAGPRGGRPAGHACVAGLREFVAERLSN